MTTAGARKRRDRRVAWIAAPCVVACVVAACVAACTEVNTAPDHVAALEFSTLASPAVVAGDSLRDTLGVAAALRAVVLNARGDTIAAPSVQYFSLDSGVTVVPGGYLVAQRRDGSVRLVASAGAIQSPPLTLLIARHPDSVVASGRTRDTITYVLAGAQNIGNALGVKVATTDTTGGITGTQGWMVSYQAFFHGAPVAPTDTTVVTILGDGAGASAVDTTDASGNASRRVYLRPAGLTQALVDSAVVLATVRYRGVPLRGSPVRFVVLFRPKS